MANRKIVRQEQVAQAIRQVNPQDRVIATLHSIAGPEAHRTCASPPSGCRS